MTKKVYQGKLISKNNFDLHLDRYDKPLNSIIQEDSEKYGNYILVKYWISNEKLSESELDEKFINTYYDIEKENDVLYFEISEYLWKNEEKGCKRDLIGELQIFIGKYCTLQIDYSKKPQNVDKSFI